MRVLLVLSYYWCSGKNRQTQQRQRLCAAFFNFKFIMKQFENAAIYN